MRIEDYQQVPIFSLLRRLTSLTAVPVPVSTTCLPLTTLFNLLKSSTLPDAFAASKLANSGS